MFGYPNTSEVYFGLIKMNIRGISAITSASEIIQPKVSAYENGKNDEGS